MKASSHCLVERQKGSFVTAKRKTESNKVNRLRDLYDDTLQFRSIVNFLLKSIHQIAYSVRSFNHPKIMLEFSNCHVECF